MPPETPNRRILVIDDSMEIWETYRQVLCLQENGNSATRQLASILEAGEPHRPAYETDPAFDLAFASQGQNGVAMIRQALEEDRPYAVAFIDIRMPPGWDGMETAAHIRELTTDLEIVIVTAYSDRSRHEIVEAVGWPEKLLFLRKPFDPEELYQLALCLTSKWNIARKEETGRRALAASEERFRNLVETTSDFIWETDKSGIFTYCSPLCEDIYGFRPAELIGGSRDNLLADAAGKAHFAATIADCVRELRPFFNLEVRSRHKDGTELFIEASAVPAINDRGEITGFRGMDRNITERKHSEAEKQRLEQQYRQSQKMEAVGTLAGGIAHDLNNILTPIIGFSEICLLKAGKDNPLHEPLSIISESAGKAADLIRQILAFSRQQKMRSQVIELNALLKKFSKILRRLIPENIELRIEPCEFPLHLSADTSQLEQILINLVVNARDAVTANGLITIRTGIANLAGDDCLNTEGGKIFGDFVVLSVSDNGCGIPPGLRDRIFDPFFTTKEVGKGTGMGLATVHGIVKQHQGHVRLFSEEGKGTTFDIFFPLLHAPLVIQDLVDGDSMLALCGDETILVVEDDDMVREIISSSLGVLGYTVLTAANGVEAIHIFSGKNAASIDLLLTDVVMPGMGGKSLVRRCRQLKPDLAVVYMSGYPFDNTMETLISMDAASYLPKPFKPRDLAMTIRQALRKETLVQDAASTKLQD